MERYLLLVFLLIFISFSSAQKIVFPADNPIANTQNKDNREPVYSPGLCPENELLYPGDQPNDWICDCAPGFVFYPTSHKCYEIYRQGPCKTAEYIVLTPTKIIPECVRNPCRNDTMVPFNGKCHKLYMANGCQSTPLQSNVLKVNETTLELQCMPSNVAGTNIISAPVIKCPPGGGEPCNK